MTAPPTLLDAEGAVAFLIHEGLLAPRALLDHGVAVDDISGRHRNFQVRLGDGSGFHVKQGDDVSGIRAVAAEASFCARAHSQAAWAPLREHVPHCLRHDAVQGVLVTELVRGGEHPLEFDDGTGEAGPARVGALLGGVLGKLHSVPLDEGGEPAAEAGPPWILGLCTPSPDWFRELSAAHLDLIRILQRDADASGVLDGIRRDWKKDAIIHRDVKWSNLLVRMAPNAVAPQHLWLVDWELAGPGDATWDVGSAFHSQLADAIHLAATGAASAAELAGRFGTALPTVQAEVRALWSAYASTRPLETGARKDFLRRAALASGARLLQSAYEWSYDQPTVPRAAAAALQLALNVLRDADGALVTLLGVAPQPGN